MQTNIPSKITCLRGRALRCLLLLCSIDGEQIRPQKFERLPPRLRDPFRPPLRYGGWFYLEQFGNGTRAAQLINYF